MVEPSGVRTPRRSRVLVAGATLALAAASFATAGGGRAGLTVPGANKISPALHQLVRDGYGDVPIAGVVAGHRAGDVYYLAKVTGMDAGLRSGLKLAGAKVRHEFPQIGWVALSSPAATVAAVAALPQVTKLQVDQVQQVL